MRGELYPWRAARMVCVPQDQWEMPGDLAVLDNIGLAEGQNIWER